MSTLVREGCHGRSLRLAARNLAVAALLESAPGLDAPQEGGSRTGQEVATLLAEGKFLYSDEMGGNVGRPEGEFDLWEAAQGADG